MKSILIRATPISLGGSVLAGLLLLVGALVWIAFQPHEPSVALRVTLLTVWVGLLAYAADAWSERIEYEGGRISFNSFFKKRVEIVLRLTDDILVVHEGLNQERGIISVRFRERGGRLIEWPLGPLWHRHHLEAFFSALEKEAGKKKMFEQVR
ncbi:hypothetical protein K8R04_00840 [Candidatus Uhrbacteria bacterium]|nr:hypothetical protein [Candidatus Uhrbacteria bacterium]